MGDDGGILSSPVAQHSGKIAGTGKRGALEVKGLCSFTNSNIMATTPKIIVVGGGLAGLAAVIKIAEAGGHVDLFSIVPVKRSHSVCAQGGINAAKNLKGEGDTTWQHFDDTIYGGDFLANQPPVKAMCEAAPAIIDLLDRMGVTFNRTPEGLLDFRRFGGTLYHRTAFAGATTGQQLLYALDEQVRRYESEGRVTKFEHWEFLSAVLDNNRVCRGICAMDLRSMEVRTFPADAIIMATGGIGAIFGKSTNSVVCTGSAQSALYQQGCFYANGEFIQVHPTSIPGEDKLRLMSESARGEGGRVWVPKKKGDKRDWKSIPESERWYFLEEWYPKYGNLVPRDVATRAIHKVVYEYDLGIDGQPMVYLDLTHIDRETLNRKLEGILEIYEKFVGDDPREVPMKIFPGMHYTMGGLWVDFNQSTNIKGIFAAGECEYSYHGANRLGANSLVSCIYGGFVAGPQAMLYARNNTKSTDGVSSTVFDSERKRQDEANAGLLNSNGTENPFRLWRELGELMTRNCTVIRYNKNLQQTDAKLVEFLERFNNINLSDKSQWANTSFVFTRQLYNMLQLSRVIAQGAALRDESRGAHYKPDFPDRDDKNFLKTTKAYFAPDADEPRFEFEPVDISLLPPRPRRYDMAK
jgi:succinate dehydrogenase / fumarate reductase flavoprotein subunit